MCTDADGAMGTPKTVIVNVIDNDEPVFTNIGGRLLYVFGHYLCVW